MNRRCAAAGWSVLFALSCGRIAAAETPKEPPPAVRSAAAADEIARSKFAAAIKLYNSGKMAEALVLFRQLVEETASPNARLYVGLCLEQLGELVTAYGELSQTAKDATLRAENKYDRTREAALAELAVLDVRVGKLVVTIPETPAGLVVRIGARTLAEREVGSPIVLEPGRHRVEATAPGRAPVVRDLRLDGGETRTVILALTGGPASSPGSAPFLRAAGFAAVGAGVAGVALFAVTGILAINKYSDLKNECGDVRCTDPRYAGDLQSGKTLQTVANVGLVTGAVLAATGGALIFLSARSEAPRLAAEPRQGGAVVSYLQRF